MRSERKHIQRFIKRFSIIFLIQILKFYTVITVSVKIHAIRRIGMVLCALIARFAAAICATEKQEEVTFTNLILSGERKFTK
jgi:hypothetical protein